MQRRCALGTESSIVAARLVATLSLPNAMVLRSGNKTCRIADSVGLPHSPVRQNSVAPMDISGPTAQRKHPTQSSSSRGRHDGAILRIFWRNLFGLTWRSAKLRGRRRCKSRRPRQRSTTRQRPTTRQGPSTWWRHESRTSRWRPLPGWHGRTMRLHLVEDLDLLRGQESAQLLFHLLVERLHLRKTGAQDRFELGTVAFGDLV